LRHARSGWALIAACETQQTAYRHAQHEARGSLMTAARQGWLLLILGVAFGTMVGEWLLR
jgi:hypothetical protein